MSSSSETVDYDLPFPRTSYIQDIIDNIRNGTLPYRDRLEGGMFALELIRQLIV